MLPTRKEILWNIGAGIRYVLGGIVVAAAGAAMLVAVGLAIYGLVIGVIWLYEEVGLIILSIPFLLGGLLYGLYVLGKTGDRKDWFRSETDKMIARNRKRLLQDERDDREFERQRRAEETGRVTA